MRDRFDREINYLRISVTDRCDLRCQYCLPPGQNEWFEKDDLLTDQEIIESTIVAISMGITKVRITGGEPLLRPGIIGLVKALSSLHGITDFAMTTNGMSLARYARDLSDAGLHRINVSMDSMDSRHFCKITGGGSLEQVQNGIRTAIAVGLKPVKINVVQMPGVNDREREALIRFANGLGVEIRFIRQMSLADGTFAPMEGGDGGNCDRCNRIRLLSDGTVKPCLFGAEGFNIRGSGIKEAFQMAITSKPARGTKNPDGRFNRIGG